MRVHVVIDRLGHGGAEMLLGDFVAAAGAAALELDVTCLAPIDGEPAARRLEELGVRPVAVPVSGLLNRAGVRAVRRRIAACGAPDVVQTHLDYADVLGGLAARGLGVPSVATLHVMRWDGVGARERARFAVCGRVRRVTAARVVAVSEAARGAYLAHGWDKPERLVTVHNGLARSPRPGTGAAVRAGLGIAADAPVVTMLSVLREGKGHRQAIEAIGLLRDEHPGMRLVIAGDGELRGELEALAAPLGDSVVFAGHRDDVMELLDASDVLAHPSAIDAFPTALLEAMAAGVPVVATRVGGIPEILRDGDTGLLIDAPAQPAALARELRSLLEDPARRRSFGRTAQVEFAERFTAEHWVRRMAALYRSLL